MTEEQFRVARTESWGRFEQMVAQERKRKKNPDVLADLFVELTDDLAWARTYYPGSATERYLNHLASQAHQAIYRRRRESRDRFLRFWMFEVPIELFHARRAMLFALVLFVVAMAIGALSTMNDPDFARSFFGDAYINETLDNIAAGDPMGIYGGTSSTEMFFQITVNNIRVSLNVFVFGALFGFGTFYFMMLNGTMLGTFHAFFHQQDTLLTSLLAVYMHGTIEIASIVVAGAAGFIMGSGLLFPGTYSRAVAFRRGALRGVKIVIGLIPFFIVAGFIESFVTRYYYISSVLNLTIILLSVALILWYFILWPGSVARKSGIVSVNEEGSGPEQTRTEPL